MSPRIILLLAVAACVSQTLAKPVRRKLNFNMFVLRPQESEDRVLLTTNGMSRFGPILEYFLQRIQGMFSIKLPQDPPYNSVNDSPSGNAVPIRDAAENEVDGEASLRMPGVVIRPSQTKPGTYELEVNVDVEDGQPEANINSVSEAKTN